MMNDSVDEWGMQVQVYCRKGNLSKWQSIPVRFRAEVFNLLLSRADLNAMIIDCEYQEQLKHQKEKKKLPTQDDGLVYHREF